MTSSKQRVFSTSESINYNDYLKKKSGQILLNNIKKKNKDACVNKFLNYQEFLNMSKSYYSFLPPSDDKINWLTNMYNTNQSFIFYSVLLEHVNSCSYCSSTKETLSLSNIKCNQLLNILYPYGITKDIKESNFYFPTSLNLKNWCSHSKKDNVKNLGENFIDCEIINNFPIKNLKESSSCGTKYNLCKNTNPLFI